MSETLPQCVHFGSCGGCQYQDLAYAEQLAIKKAKLVGLLDSACVTSVPASLVAHSGEPYSYRNRIRLRVMTVDGVVRFGYNMRGTTNFLPITMCPIAAPRLWSTAEALLDVTKSDRDTSVWIAAATECELFADDTLNKVQMTLLCPPRTRLPQGSFARMMRAIVSRIPEIVGAGAVALDPKIGRTGTVFEEWGAAGLNYRVGDESYWVSRGGFFQVSRFLLPEFVELVTKGRSGSIAWDLFAGVGLFSRVLAKSFAHVTAVEANPTAARDLATALKKHGPQHRAVQETTLAFLERAVVERERPELVVLDPPRAGAGARACELIARLEPREIVYVSCDPETLARDWKALEQSGYRASEAHLVDLFPQTFHLEAVVVFHRGS